MTEPARPPLPRRARVLSIPVESVRFIIDELRERTGEQRSATGLQQLHAFIDGLPPDQQADLVALTWLGHDDCLPTDWPAIRGDTAETHYARTARYLLGMSMVGHFLEQGLSILGCAGEHARVGQPPDPAGNDPEMSPPSTRPAAGPPPQAPACALQLAAAFVTGMAGILLGFGDSAAGVGAMPDTHVSGSEFRRTPVDMPSRPHCISSHPSGNTP
ncbi:DUF3775 domain-containing protein [Rhodanobacter ginsengiterrae]|uniref:DUF3775 domain-containing protein n=1 Tax=Rhodanobacter ginsengiterrae TaxID=2008451 RepID=UPI003CECAFD9